MHIVTKVFGNIFHQYIFSRGNEMNRSIEELFLSDANVGGPQNNTRRTKFRLIP